MMRGGITQTAAVAALMLATIVGMAGRAALGQTPGGGQAF